MDDEWLKTRLVFPWLLTPGIFFLINNSNTMVLQHNFKTNCFAFATFLCLLLYTSSILMVFRLCDWERSMSKSSMSKSSSSSSSKFSTLANCSVRFDLCRRCRLYAFCLSSVQRNTAAEVEVSYPCSHRHPLQSLSFANYRPHTYLHPLSPRFHSRSPAMYPLRPMDTPAAFAVVDLA